MNKDIINKLTLKEKIEMLQGHDNMKTYKNIDKGIEEIIFSDGPSGIRKELDNGDSLSNISNALPTTCFPTCVTIASTWNIDLVKEMGDVLGDEAKYFGINLLLGPAINIHRNPLCGRNFEYYSEDPFLSGKIASSFVKGIESKNIGACIKHFACNNNEKYRYIGDSIVDKRALHEIYLKPFETVINEVNPYAIMTSYNKINGEFASENKYLLNDYLRSKLKYDGVIMTDWGGLKDRDKALKNGLDLEMPGSIPYNSKLLYDNIKNNNLDQELLDKSILRLIDLKNKTNNKKIDNFDFNKGYDIAYKLAIEGAILLKNDNDILPINKNEKLLIIGDLFRNVRYQGSGSSMLNPIKLKNHIDVFNENNINYEFELGYLQNENEPNLKLEEDAINKCNDYDKIIVYAGLNDYVESEGYDRDNLSLPKNQLSLINRLIKLNKKIIIVLFGGAPVELPFINNIDAILYMGLSGEAIGDATYYLLFGIENPSGKLTDTWPLKYDDVPFSTEFTKSPYELYKESIFIGYRYFNTVNKNVLFPFGYGLSYSKYKYSNLKIRKIENDINIKFNIKNIGNKKGKEVSEIYIGKNDSKIIRPKLELKGFKKIELDINEEKEISINININDLKVFIDDEYKLENGIYQIYVGNNSSSILLEGELELEGAILNRFYYDEIYYKFILNNELSNLDFSKIIEREIPNYEYGKRPYTIETPIGEFNTFYGRIFKKIFLNVGLKQIKKASKMKDGLEKERMKKAGIFMYRLMPYNSLRSLSFSSSGKLQYNVAEGILEFANGHPLKGIRKMLKKYKIKE